MYYRIFGILNLTKVYNLEDSLNKIKFTNLDKEVRIDEIHSDLLSHNLHLTISMANTKM